MFVLKFILVVNVCLICIINSQTVNPTEWTGNYNLNNNTNKLILTIKILFPEVTIILKI